MSDGFKGRGGSAKEGPHVRGGSELGSYEDLMNVSRILALGGSIRRVLRVLRLGGAQFLLCRRVGPLKKDLTCVGGSELGSYEDLMNVSRILAPGGSICRVLRGSEALGGLTF